MNNYKIGEIVPITWTTLYKSKLISYMSSHYMLDHLRLSFLLTVSNVHHTYITGIYFDPKFTVLNTCQIYNFSIKLT